MHYARARAYHNSVIIVNVDRMLTLIIAHPAGELNSSMNSQRVRAGRDLESSLLKGRRSRLYKQHTSLQCSIITDSIEVLSSLGWTQLLY